MVTTIDFTQSDYNDSMPSFGNPGSYDKRLRFANKSATLELGNTDYGYGVYQFSYSGSMDYISICFLDSDGGSVSVSSDLNSLYRISNEVGMWELIIKNDSYSGPTTFNVIVNGDETQKTERLTVLIAMGKRGVPPINSSLTITCDCSVPLYKYEAGVHVYSDYDAIDSFSKLRTELYSRIPIELWTIDTPVYASAFFQNPAQPYYYGINDKVYKIGGRYDRSYGTQNQITTKKKLFGKTKTSSETFGPQLWYDPIDETSDACTMPFFEGVGKIRGIFNSSSLVQPTKYRYYLGYDSSVKRQSNDSVFTEYSFVTRSHNPIIGATHALSKLLIGLVSGYRRDLIIGEFIVGATTFGLAFVLGTAKGISLLIPATPYIGTMLSGPGVVKATIWNKSLLKIVPKAAGFLKSAGAWALSASVFPWLIAGLIILGLILLFSTKTKRYREPCKKFLHHFTNKPYIELSTEGDDTTLYRNNQLSVVNNGFYCDGVYYYEQSDGKITSKELSYTNAIVNNNPVQFEFQYSIQADSPTLVVDYNKLTILPYISGKPLPFCNGTIYYNNQNLTQTISPNCCDLETATETIIRIETGSEYSCFSQQDANDKAQAAFDAALDYALNYANYCSPFDDEQLGVLDSYFTHELKIETIPTKTTVYYDSTLGNVSVGTNLYYDNSGCQKVLDGYYGVTGSPIYCVFYHTTNGAIDGIFYMENSSSTTTTTGQAIITTNLNYSSNWFYTDSNVQTLTYMTNYFDNTPSFNPNSLYSDVQMKKGFINNLTTLEDFQLYNDFIGTTYNEAPSGWYRPLVDWISEEPFYYYREQTITLNVVERCGSIFNRGFFINSVLDGVPTTTTNPISMVVNVYSQNIGLSGTYNVKTSNISPSTFVKYGNKIGFNEVVTGITITNITTPNPLNKTTYVIGSSTVCYTPTPTPTLPPGVECGGSLSATGNQGYYEVNAVVGSNTGTVAVTFNAISVPDRFQIFWDNNLVADSLFVGDDLSGDGGTAGRNAFISNLSNIGSLNKFTYVGTGGNVPGNSGWNTNGTISVSYGADSVASNDNNRSSGSFGNQLNVVANYPSSGALSSDGDVKLSFNKTAPNPTNIKIVAIGVNSNTVWNIINLECPLT
jgi:hypothetical protein